MIHQIKPKQKRLAAVLKEILLEEESFNGGLEVVRRESNIQGTFSKEIVTCRLGNDEEIQLFCKYETAGDNHNDHGHRGGVALEAKVYQELLEPLAVSAPRLIGVFSDIERDEIWLILEYLENGMRIKLSTDPDAMGLAARWIGQFHATYEDRRQTASMSYLRSYDNDYYLNWVQRTLRYSNHLVQKHPWIKPISEHFEKAVAILLNEPLTVIHGEYYPHNILYRDGIVYPVDWESAALAAGEIDLASLTEGWSEEVARECVRQYQSSRWPNASPPKRFEKKLWAARIYLQFRWLSYGLDADTKEWRLNQLHTAGKQLGMI
jgi:hypothetical protein